MATKKKTITKMKILALAPHPDDIEFGAGASINRFVEEGHQIWYLAFSPCNKSLPEGYAKNHIYNELKNSCKVLGIPDGQIKTYDFEVREFPKNRQDILEELYKTNKEIRPDLVLLPNSSDIHQDHKIINEEGVRAFKRSSILGYELPWNNLHSNQRHFIKLEEKNLMSKVKAIQEYESQKGRNYANEGFIKGLAKTRGIQIGVNYAEAFEVIRWIQ